MEMLNVRKFMQNNIIAKAGPASVDNNSEMVKEIQLQVQKIDFGKEI